MKASRLCEGWFVTHGRTCGDNYCVPGGRPRARAGEGRRLVCELRISATASAGSLNEDGQYKLTKAKTSPEPRWGRCSAPSCVSSHFSLFDSPRSAPPPLRSLAGEASMRTRRGPVNHRLFSLKRSRLGGSRRSLKVSYLVFFSR